MQMHSAPAAQPDCHHARSPTLPISTPALLQIAPLVPAHVRPACLHWYSKLSEHLERGVGMLQAGDITLVLDKVRRGLNCKACVQTATGAGVLVQRAGVQH